MSADHQEQWKSVSQLHLGCRKETAEMFVNIHYASSSHCTWTITESAINGLSLGRLETIR